MQHLLTMIKVKAMFQVKGISADPAVLIFVFFQTEIYHSAIMELSLYFSLNDDFRIEKNGVFLFTGVGE